MITDIEYFINECVHDIDTSNGKRHENEDWNSALYTAKLVQNKLQDIVRNKRFGELPPWHILVRFHSRTFRFKGTNAVTELREYVEVLMDVYVTEGLK